MEQSSAPRLISMNGYTAQVAPHPVLPSATPNAHSIATVPQVSTEQPEKPFWYRTIHDPLAIFTLALVASTVLLWRATLRLAREARESSTEQGRKMERSIVESTKATEAMREANEIARDTAKRQLRAYLSIAGNDDCEVVVGAPVAANLTIKNDGQTPAHDVVVTVQVSRKAHPINPASFAVEPNEVADSKLMIAAGQSVYSYTELNATTQAEHDAFAADAISYFTYGLITYRDIFDDEHATKFRLALQKNGLWKACSEGNEAT